MSRFARTVCSADCNSIRVQRYRRTHGALCSRSSSGNCRDGSDAVPRESDKTLGRGSTASRRVPLFASRSEPIRGPWHYRRAGSRHAQNAHIIRYDRYVFQKRPGGAKRSYSPESKPILIHFDCSKCSRIDVSIAGSARETILSSAPISTIGVEGNGTEVTSGFATSAFGA